MLQEAQYCIDLSSWVGGHSGLSIWGFLFPLLVLKVPTTNSLV